MFSASART